MRITLRTAFFLLSVLVFFIAPMIVFAENDVEIHGFMSQGYLKSSANNYLTDTDEGSYEFNEFGLNFQYFASDKLTIGAQLGGRDMGTVGNDKVGLSWAYGDYKWREWLGFRAGITKGETSLYTETRDIDALRPWILLPQSIYAEGNRDASEGLKGLTLYGTLDMNSSGILKYTAKAARLQVANDSGTAQALVNNTPGISDVSSIDFSTVYLGTLKWQTPIEGLLVSTDGVFIEKYSLVIPVSIAGDFDGNPATPLNVITTDYLAAEVKNIVQMYYGLEYTLGNLVLAAELSKSDTTIVNVGDRSGTGWYVSAAYRFLDWFEAGTYYSDSSANDDQSGPENELKQICLTARFDISPNMTCKLETHFMDGLYGVYPGDDGTTDDSWMLYAAKVSYNF